MARLWRAFFHAEKPMQHENPLAAGSLTTTGEAEVIKAADVKKDSAEKPKESQ